MIQHWDILLMKTEKELKRIEVIIATENVNKVNNALKNAGVGGVTIHEGKGRGATPKAEITGARGTARFVSEFYSRSSIVTIVDDSKVDAVINAITGAVSTGSLGDGKILISSIDEAIDIGTKKRGKDTI